MKLISMHNLITKIRYGLFINFLSLLFVFNSSSYLLGQNMRIFDYTNKAVMADADAWLISESDHDYYYFTLGNLKAVLDDYQWTYTKTINFNGANFLAGTSGSLITNDTLRAKAEAYFEDPVWLSDFTYCYSLQPESGSFYSYIGSSIIPYDYIYSNNFVLVNPSSTDTSYITWEADGKIYFDDPVVIGSTEIQSNGITPTDSAASNYGSENLPLDTIYTQGIYANHDIAIIAQGIDELHSAPPDSIWHRGVLLKPGRILYSQTYPTDASTTSLTVKSEVCILSPSAIGGSIDTLYIGNELITYGVPIVTIYNKGSNPITITDTNGAGFTNCIRLKGDVTLSQYDLIRLFYDSNIQQWIQLGSVTDID